MLLRTLLLRTPMATTSKIRKHKDVLHAQAAKEPRRRTYPVARALFAKEQPPLRLKRVVQEEDRSRMPLQPVPIELVPTPPSESEQLVVALADTLKKRESEIIRVVDDQCQTTISDVAERLQGFVDETGQKFDEAISHYKCHTTGLDEEQSAALKRLRTGFDKYQMITSTLLESLEKIEVQLGRARKEFDKEIGQMVTTHRTRRAQLKSQTDKLCVDYRRRVSSTIKETEQASAYKDAMRGLFNL